MSRYSISSLAPLCRITHKVGARCTVHLDLVGAAMHRLNPILSPRVYAYPLRLPMSWMSEMTLLLVIFFFRPISFELIFILDFLVWS